jgi:aldehyde reductase
LNQKKFIKFLKDLDIAVTAYSPLTRPYEYLTDQTLPRPAHFDDRVKKIGEKYGKSSAQIVLRFLSQLGAIPIPTPDDEKQAVENLNIFDFKLSDDEIKFMETFHTGQRSFPLEFCRGHKYFMFNEEF